MPLLDLVQGITPASLLVMYVFLPFLLVLFYRVPLGHRIKVLVLASVVYMVLVQPMGVVPMLLSVLGSYAVYYGQAKKNTTERQKKIIYALGIILNIGIFIAAGAYSQLQKAPPILGATVYPVMALISLARSYNNQDEEPIPMGNFVLECMFFPKLYGGPFTDFSAKNSVQIHTEVLTPALLQKGGSIFVVGAFKVTVLSRTLQNIYSTLATFEKVQISVLSSWLQVIVFMLAFYFAVSGFLQMTKGIGIFFGINYPLSSQYPFQAESITEFVQCFHSSLQKTVYQYIYQPLQSDNIGKIQDSAMVILTMMVFGLWFGFGLNFALWGGVLGLFLALEKYVYPKFIKKGPKIVVRGYLLGVVLLSAPLIARQQGQECIALFREMFSVLGGRIPLSNGAVLYIISSNWVVIVVAMLFATKIFKVVAVWLAQVVPKLWPGIVTVVNIALLGIITAVLVW